MVTECSRESLVLIDGYNLYHSLLEIEADKGHKVRWLDIRKLSERLLNRLFPPKCPYPHILFFTAYSIHKGEDHVERQKAYHQCLKRMGIKIVTDGVWAKKDVSLAHHFKDAPAILRPYLSRKFQTIVTHVEKGTDVSLAAHLMHLGPKAKWVCIISGDADLIPAIDLFKKTSPSVQLGLARPYKRETRKMNMSHCTNISPEDCLACLLPNPAPSKKRDIAKPEHW
jgi:uncharacterized LabA/DUF88 family protein